MCWNIPSSTLCEGWASKFSTMVNVARTLGGAGEAAAVSALTVDDDDVEEAVVETPPPPPPPTPNMEKSL